MTAVCSTSRVCQIGEARAPRLDNTNEITGGFLAAPGSARHVVLSELESVVQMLPIEHGEKAETFFSETGDLRFSASQPAYAGSDAFELVMLT